MSICRIICSNCGSDFVYKLYSPGNGVYCNDCYNLLSTLIYIILCSKN